MSNLNKRAIAFYTGKWFLIWSLKIFAIGLMAAVTILAFLKSTCGQASHD
jgi:hypothetical protein